MSAEENPGRPGGPALPGAGRRRYAQNPKPIGSPVSFVLEGDRLSVETGRKTFDLRLSAVEEVRMTYEPGRMSRRVYRTRLRMKDGRTVTFTSLNWKSLMEAQELGPAYRAFAGSLFRAVAEASPGARFVAGQPRWRWGLTAGIAVGCLLAMAVLVWRALQGGATSLALMAVLLAAIGIWQLEPMVRLNRPRPFGPDRPPPELMPSS
ncbi:MAG: hypothetical protein ABWY78_23055 [Microvirga sp.]